MFGPEGLTLLLALWRKSMKLAWARTFVMTNTELIYKSGLKNRESLNKHRNKLVQAGLFQYRPPAKGKSDATYILEFDLILAFQNKVVDKVVSVADNSTDNFEVVKEPVSLADNFPDRLTDNLPCNLADNPTDNLPDTIDRKIDRLIDGRIESHVRIPNPWDQLQQDFISTFKCNMTNQHYEMVNGYLDDGIDIQLVLLGLEEAKNNEANFPKYLWRVLDSWLNNGIKTIDDYRHFMQQKNDQQVVNTNATSRKRSSEPDRVDEELSKWLSRSTATSISNP